VKTVTGIDGKEYKWVIKTKKSKPSKLHSAVLEVVKDVYPNYKILEEVRLFGSGNRDLYADIMVVSADVVIEVQGAQHNNYTQHFHGDIVQYSKSKARDKNKKLWCELNGYTFIECNYDEGKDEWRNKLVQ
jgi:hypothetical protein